MAALNWKTIYTEPIKNDIFYISADNIPPEIKLPAGITYKDYYLPDDDVPVEVLDEIVTFTNEHNYVHGGNITRLSREILEKWVKVYGGLTILRMGKMLIGTMLSLVYNFKYKETTGNTSYTTYLCVHSKFRGHSLAMALIRSNLRIASLRANTFHGCYLTPESHWKPERKMGAWYRPIDLSKAEDAGFQINPFTRKNEKPNKKRINMIYCIREPQEKCQLVDVDQDYQDFIKAFNKPNSFCFAPTFEQWKGVCSFYKTYRIGDDFFGLFITDIEVADTHKIVTNSYLAFASSPKVLNHALLMSKELNCVLMCGLYFGCITKSEIETIRGSTTTAECFLEMYNCREDVTFPVTKFHFPLF
jgi:hypothetical protein